MGVFDYEALRVGMNGDGKSQAHCHARRVVFQRLVNELPKLGEFDNFIFPFLQLLAAHAKINAVEVDILPPGQFGIEAGAKLKQTGDFAATPDLPRIGQKNSCH